MKTQKRLCLKLSILVVIFFCLISTATSQNALHFDGTDDYVQVPNASGQILSATGISLSLWVYPTNTASAFPNFDGFGGFRNDANCDFYICQLSSSTIEARFRNSSGTGHDISSPTLVLNVWQHYVLTMDGSLLKLYRNGQFLTSVAASGSISNATVPLYIGKLVYSANNFCLMGKVDEFSVWNKALTASEVTAIYNGAIYALDPNLKLYYKFDQGVANGNNAGIATLNDTKGNANGTLYNLALNGTTSNWVSGVITSLPTDAGIQAVVLPGDTICSGQQPVRVVLKNFGPTPLATVKINWQVNNQVQPQYTWTGNLAVNASDTPLIGNYPFHPDTLYTIMAFTTLPNVAPDTASLNDSITRTGIHIKAAPTIAFSSATYGICQGDTALITGTLTGTPPWSLVISNGTAQQTLSGITSSAFSYPATPVTHTTYSILSITDAGGCPNTVPAQVLVTVNPAPPAVINPSGTAALCSGDSLTLMASVGLNFSYQWKRDGVDIPNATNYIYKAKQGGAYSVKITSPIGCASISAAVTVIVHPPPPVYLGNDTVVNPATKITLNAGTGYSTYLWSTGQTSQTIQVDSTGTGLGIKTVWVVVTDNQGCKGSDTIKITFAQNPGLNQSFARKNFTISPNPSSGVVRLNLCDLGIVSAEIRVFSLAGSQVYHRSDAFGKDCVLEMDLTKLPGGTYLLVLESAESERYQQVLVLQ